MKFEIDEKKIDEMLNEHVSIYPDEKAILAFYRVRRWQELLKENPNHPDVPDHIKENLKKHF